MAVARRPLVLLAGILRELPMGDLVLDDVAAMRISALTRVLLGVEEVAGDLATVAGAVMSVDFVAQQYIVWEELALDDLTAGLLYDLKVYVDEATA